MKRLLVRAVRLFVAAPLLFALAAAWSNAADTPRDASTA